MSEITKQIKKVLDKELIKFNSKYTYKIIYNNRLDEYELSININDSILTIQNIERITKFLNEVLDFKVEFLGIYTLLTPTELNLLFKIIFV